MTINDLKPGTKIWTAILGELKKEFKESPEEPYVFIESETYFNEKIGKEVYDTYPNPPKIRYNIKPEIKIQLDNEFKIYLDNNNPTEKETWDFFINRQDNYYRKYEWTELTISEIWNSGHELIYFVEPYYDDIREKTISGENIFVYNMFFKDDDNNFIRIVDNSKKYNKEGKLI
jgi:hypothetical protein